LTILGTIFGWFKRGWCWIKRLFRKKNSDGMNVPSKTIILQTNAGPFWWHMGYVAGREEQHVMQICGEFFVTNVSKHDIHIRGAKLRIRNLLKNLNTTGNTSVRAQDSAYFSSEYIIPVGCVSTVHFWFGLHPPIQNTGKPFKADVAIIDQFDNEHWSKKLKFFYS
jgi:hypothetical protein